VLALQATSIQARVELAPCKNNYSPQQQIQLGQKAAAQVYKQMPVLPDSSPVTQYIQQLGINSPHMRRAISGPITSMW